MGKASSAKKVARAAKAGGKKTGTSRQLGFPLAIAAVVVLGLGLVAYARSSGQLGSDAKGHPQVGEHWHAAYGVYICDHFVQSVADRAPDTLGIHTHQDGLVHIHPFSSGAAGKQASFNRFFDQTGLKVTNSEVKLPAASPFKGRTYKEGSTTCNGKPAVVEITHWKSALTASEGVKATKVFTSDFGKVRFSEDQGAYTISFAAKGTKIPPPPNSAEIVTLGQADSGAQAADTSATTVPGGAVDTGSTPATVAGSTPATTGSTPATTAGSTAPAATDTP